MRCPQTEKERRVFAKLALTCTIDPRFTLAARHHAETLIQSADTISTGRMEHLRFTLHQLGAHDYRINPIVTSATPLGLTRLANRAASISAEWSHCGLGVAEMDERSVAVLVGARRSLEIAPLSHTVIPPKNLRLKVVSIKRPPGELMLYLGRPDTTVVTIQAQRTTNHFHFDIPIETTGRYELELLHNTGHGPETVMLVPIFSGIQPDKRPIVIPDVKTEEEESGETLLHYLNSARARVGALPLDRDPQLDHVAAAHSQDMAKHQFFGHISPYNGGLARRLKRERLSPKISAENIAESATPLRIHRNLMASPAHRINMLNPMYTHVGIGVHESSKALIATQIYAAW